MVASTHNLDDLGVGHLANANNEIRQQHQNHHHSHQQQPSPDKHSSVCRSAQTAQDKRSRLSNVINNLRKKVPETKCNSSSSNIKEEDSRNSVERNLETLEKYVMTVLSGVIKEEEESKREPDPDRTKDPGKALEIGKDLNDSGGDGVAVPSREENFQAAEASLEPSEANESKVDAAVPSSADKKIKEVALDSGESVDGGTKTNVDTRLTEEKKISDHPNQNLQESKHSNADNSNTNDVKGLEDNKRTLGKIILDRLSDRLQDSFDSSSSAIDKESNAQVENSELRSICKELLNDLLNDIIQAVEPSQTEPNTAERSKDSEVTAEPSTKGLHCSLPLDKVVSVLQNCQTPESNSPTTVAPSVPTPEDSVAKCSSHEETSSSASHSPAKQAAPAQSPAKNSSKPLSPTVRLLCLYCDRKFLSISLRQRHTERVHQLGGGRRSERNSRKPSQNCQYCAEKCAESLEGLFKHMVGKHGDKYHGCLQCSTRYLTKEKLATHQSEVHGISSPQISEKIKDATCKESYVELTHCTDLVSYKELSSQSLREKKERDICTKEDSEIRGNNTSTKSLIKESVSNVDTPEFDISFYSNVSCNIRENLLHHLDGKLQANSASGSVLSDTKGQTLYEHNPNQIQMPIDISLLAATPVYSKDCPSEVYENSSEYAQKPGKSNRAHPRRVSFEKYNFPRKYDGKEQWSCSIKDLSKFDISTQLTLRKKQQLIKERLTLNRLQQTQLPESSVEVTQTEIEDEADGRTVDKKEDIVDNKEDVKTENNVEVKEVTEVDVAEGERENSDEVKVDVSNVSSAEEKNENNDVMCVSETDSSTTSTFTSAEFSGDFQSFIKLKKWDVNATQAQRNHTTVYAELTGEWSRPRVYICGACTAKHVTLKELEEHKTVGHPNVWCQHFEFAGDQLELYKHISLPGGSVPTTKAKNAVLPEKICTKCSKICSSLAELHRHMLECGGDQAWLLGLFGNGKKKCKWRPFGSRSRRRRQRGMKRNIQNSQTPRVNTGQTSTKEKQPPGPRVRPSDRESIQKMLANLPAKRSTRKVLQENAARSQGRLRNIQSRSGTGNNTASRLTRDKAVLRNKLLKNAKSFQRQRRRNDNISAIIESVVKRCKAEKEAKKVVNNSGKAASQKSQTSEDPNLLTGRQTKVLRSVRVLSKKKNIKTKTTTIRNVEQREKTPMLRMRKKPLVKATDQKMSVPVVKHAAAVKNAAKSGKGAENSKTKMANNGESSPNAIKNASALASAGSKKKKKVADTENGANAQVKVKSQLRASNGKFVRPITKAGPIVVMEDLKRPMISIRKRPNGAIQLLTRSKVKRAAAQKTKKDIVTVPRRASRLSSDNDKMPVLEPAIELYRKEDLDKLPNNELPILSPATTVVAGGPKPMRVSSRNSSISRKSQDGKCGVEDQILVVSVDKSSVELKLKQQSQEGRMKKPKRDASESGTEMNSDSPPKKTPSAEGSTREVRSRVRKNAAAVNETVTRRSTSSKEQKEKKEDNQSPQRILKINIPNINQEEKVKTGLETRSNSRPKRSDSIDESCKDLVVTVTLKKIQSPIKEIVKVRDSIDSIGKEVSVDNSTKSDTALPEVKIQKVRKSPRKSEKKNIVENKAEEIQSNKIDLQENANANTSSDSTVQAKDDSIKEVSVSIESMDTETNKIKETETAGDASVKKNKVIGKRSGRIKRNAEKAELQNKQKSGVDADNVDKENTQTDRTEKEDSFWEITEKQEGLKLTIADDPAKPDELKNKDVADLTNFSIEQLQQVSANSNIDSGKENTLETITSVPKVKAGRPKKTKGLRRERASKRSLNSVIGILTEGVNVPTEMQESVVLTVQTTFEASNSDVAYRSSDQPLIESNPSSSNVSNTENDDKSVENTSNVNVVPSSSEKLTETSVNTIDNRTVENDVTKTSEETAMNLLAENTKPSAKTDANQETSSNVYVGENKINSPVAASSTQDPSANDIILDLSRRKTKGKGSFLEKIVSKIAKQKDALLEGDLTTVQDSGIEELSSVSNSLPNSSKNVDTTINSQVESIKSDDTYELITLPSTNSEEDIKESLDESTKQGDSTKQSESTEDTDVIKCKINETECDQSIENEAPKESKDVTDLTVSVEGEKGNENSTDQVDGTIERSNILVSSISSFNQTISPEDGKETKPKRQSKKRSLEYTSPKKSKRRSANPEEPVEEELEENQLAGIMKLIDRSQSSNEIMRDSSTEGKQMKFKAGKRKTPEEDNEINVSMNHTLEDSLSTSVTEQKEPVRKSKRKANYKRTKVDNLPEPTESVVLPNDSTSDVHAVIDTSNVLQVSTETTFAESENLPKEQSDNVKENLSLNTEMKITKEKELSKPASKNKKKTAKGNAEKKMSESLVSDQSDLDMSDVGESADSNSRKKKSLDSEDNSQSSKKTSKKKISLNNIIAAESSVESNPIEVSDVFKVPEVAEASSSLKKRTSKRKSLVDTNNTETKLPEIEDLMVSEVHDKSLETSLDLSSDTNSSNVVKKPAEPQSSKKRNSRRSTSANKLTNSLENVAGGISDSNDSDTSASSESVTSGKRRSQRNYAENVKETSSEVNKPEVTCAILNEKKSVRKTSKKSLFEEHMELLDVNSATTANTEGTTTDIENEDVVREDSAVSTEDLAAKEMVIEDTPVITEATACKEDEVPKLEDNKAVNLSEPEVSKDSDKIVTDQSIQDSRVDEDEIPNTDLQTPKKRPGGNFAVVHTKTGEILIVEKKKKLTKEVAKFFCSVCATSFTRKSSLKKHNVSQSHLLQLSKNASSSEDKELEDHLDDSNMESEQVVTKTEKESMDSIVCTTHVEEAEPIQKKPEPIELNISNSTETSSNNVALKNNNASLIIPKPPILQSSSVDSLEDEMLDEEICKITENMSHDEYVLTDHISPPAASTPIKTVSKPDKKTKKKYEKKKKNLANEHLDLDSPIQLPQNETIASNLQESVSEINLADVSLNTNVKENSLKDIENDSLQKMDKTLEENLKKVRKNTKNDGKNESFKQKKSEKKDKDMLDETRRSADTSLERPKRNKTRINYKEEEKLDFDKNEAEKNVNTISESAHQVESPPEDTKDVNNRKSKSRRKKELITGQEETSARTIEDLSLETSNTIDSSVEKSTILEELGAEQIDVSNTSNRSLGSKKSKAGKRSQSVSKKSHQSEHLSLDTPEPDCNPEPLVNVDPPLTSNLNYESTSTPEKCQEMEIEKSKPITESKRGRKSLKTKEPKLSPEEIEQPNKHETTKSKKLEKKSAPEMRKSNREKNSSVDTSVERPKRNKSRICYTEEQKVDLEKVSQELEKLETPNNTDSNIDKSFIFDTVKNVTDKRKSRNRRSKDNSNTPNESKEAPKQNQRPVVMEPTENLEDCLFLGPQNQNVVEIKLTESYECRLRETLNQSHESVGPIITKPIHFSHVLEYSKDDISETGPNDFFFKCDASKDKYRKDEDSQPPLIFPSISEKASLDDSKNDINATIATEFDSDENSLDTNMSVDIQKLLDDPEMTADSSKQSDIQTISSGENLISINSFCAESVEQEVESDVGKAAKKLLESKAEKSIEIHDDNTPKASAKTSKTKLPKEDSVKKSKARKGRRSLKSKIVSKSSESDNSDNEERPDTKNKSKIMKSVFGRVFGGERVDKVKEVLDDWVSRSEGDSYDSDAANESQTKLTPKETKEPKKRNEKLNAQVANKIEAAESDGTAQVSSRCRQSKKRAEERISNLSKVFEDETAASYGARLNRGQKCSKVLRNQGKTDLNKSMETITDEVYNEEDSSVHLPEDPERETLKKHGTSGGKRNKKRHTNEIAEDSKLQKEKRNNSDELLSLETHLPKNRSFTPQSHVESDNEVNIDEDEQDEDRLTRLRMSPVYVYDTPRSSLGSATNSENEDDGFDDENSQKKCFTANEFSGEKVVIRTPPSSDHNRLEVVTIAPTGAVEDNALDGDMIISSQQKSRQGKVLNFDEELFVECCSRLKATTEKELRGAKKIKLDHFDGNHHRKEDQTQVFRTTKDRWRDVESQNSLGSLLESVNQLLGEEMNSNHDKEYTKRSERSSQSASPDISRTDNLGYEDSLDVAFEHNNKLRDKIQQRMRESENLIASSFGQKNCAEFDYQYRDPRLDNEGNVELQMHSNLSNGLYENDSQDRFDRSNKHGCIDSSPYKSKINNGLGGLLDKALSNLLHSNEKHDHNEPMKVLAELACARAPTSTTPEKTVLQEKITKTLPNLKESSDNKLTNTIVKKNRNAIKELFERKKVLHERKYVDKLKIEARFKSSSILAKAKKSKRAKFHHKFPLIRSGHQRGGLVERKKRRDGFDRKKDTVSSKIKDIYDFDDEESQSEPTFVSVLSYRTQLEKVDKGVKSKDEKADSVVDKIDETLDNEKLDEDEDSKSASDPKNKDIDKFAPKTKGALKSYQGDGKQQNVTGPMDDFVERKQRTKRASDQTKHSKSKKKVKGAKKKSRNSWYEDDSSDEFVTAIKADDVGVGITKSQRTCSKGKQNLFAEMSSTSSESEFEKEVEKVVDEDLKKQTPKKPVKKVEKEKIVIQEDDVEKEKIDWTPTKSKESKRSDTENKKSESEMSEYPLVIDERKEPDEQINSDEEPLERTFEQDDLYREDSTEVDSDQESMLVDKEEKTSPKTPEIRDKKQPEVTNSVKKFTSLDDSLDILDRNEIQKESKKPKKNSNAKSKENQSKWEEEEEKRVQSPVDETFEEDDDDVPELPEKLSSNEKPTKQADNLPLHVFLSRKVQESKKRKQQELKKLQEEQERILVDLQPTRRQRKCAIGKQGLLAEISSSDEECSTLYRKPNEKTEANDKVRKQKRESKEKRKERYIEKKHEQMIAKEQKAIEEAIMRELEEKKHNSASETASSDAKDDKQTEDLAPEKLPNKEKPVAKKNLQKKKEAQDVVDGQTVKKKAQETTDKKKPAKLTPKVKKAAKSDEKTPVANKKTKMPNGAENTTVRSVSVNRKERRGSIGKREDDNDEELRTTKSWNKVDEAVGVAIGRRKRAAVNQLYYWSSSSDEDEPVEEPAPPVEEEEDDRQEQHGWIVGDSHKKMITMLALEKQMKEKRRRSEDDYEPGKAKNKKHRNSTS